MPMSKKGPNQWVWEEDADIDREREFRREIGGALPVKLLTTLSLMNFDEYAVWLDVACGVAAQLMGEGRQEYGPLNLMTDNRDLWTESRQEALDVVTYHAMAKVRSLLMMERLAEVHGAGEE